MFETLSQQSAARNGVRSRSSDESIVDVLIIGAGAAGLTAAIMCGERFRKEGVTNATIRVLDSRPKIGAKILVAGGGRCNVTNIAVDATRFHTTNTDRGPKSFVARVLRSFSTEETHRFFDSIGVPLTLEPEMGKYFPVANSGRAVLEALLQAVKNAGAELITDCAVTNIEYSKDDKLWTVQTVRGTMTSRAVVLCTGGLALPKSGSNGAGLRFAEKLGHTIQGTTPALSPLISQPTIHSQLSGITIPARLALRDGEQLLAKYRGSFLFTHVGYSGPPALNISRHFIRERDKHPRAQITLRLLPDIEDEAVNRFWHDFMGKNAKKTLVNALSEVLPRRVAEAIVEYSKARDATVGKLSAEQSLRAKTALFDWPLPVVQVGDYVKAEATAGGVSLDEIESASMMSKLHAGLFFAGEICDVDGWLGGYNFQWAWSSGAVAGRSAAKYATRLCEKAS